MKRQSIKKALILSFTTLLMTQCGENEDVIDNTNKSTVNTSQVVSSSIERCANPRFPSGSLLSSQS